MNQGVTMVPLVTHNVTWFVPATGLGCRTRSPPPPAATTDPFAFLLSYANLQISYARMSIPTPAHIAHVPNSFTTQWNEVLPAPRISTLNPCGLLWLALAPTA